MKTFGAFVLMFLLASFAITGPRKTEARMCKAPSKLFRGMCGIRDSNCDSVCKAEGMAAGDCHGFRRRCICSRPCP
ncbi:defensin D2-like [Amaranthus tricolor]|uniref:defensin D2-like n=1 Tax=Amaranthus tricolor TaxID=29722 RepID=UPI00258387E5|nr:defensin D2-like [Amaranthus tricolor]